MNTKPYRPYAGRRRHPWRAAFLCLLLIGALCFLALEGYVIANGRDDVRGQPEVMVILGAKLNDDGPSLFLRRRLEKALGYLEEHPDTVVVVSGSQGEDEPDTEANGMEAFLRDNGFEGTILKEDKSHNTKQNLVNSKALLAGEGYDVADGVILVSNDFHLARVKLLARHFGYEVSTLAAPSDHLGSKIYNYLREPVGFVKAFLLDW